MAPRTSRCTFGCAHSTKGNSQRKTLSPPGGLSTNSQSRLTKAYSTHRALIASSFLQELTPLYLLLVPVDRISLKLIPLTVALILMIRIRECMKEVAYELLSWVRLRGLMERCLCMDRQGQERHLLCLATEECQWGNSCLWRLKANNFHQNLPD